MKVRALAFDLDNTLLDRNKRIGPRTAAALEAWLDAGRPAFLATSRPLRSVRRDVPKWLLERCSLVTMNGAVSQSPGGAPRAHGLLGEAARAIVGHACLARLSVEMDGLGFGSNTAHLHSDEELWDIQSATRDMLIPFGEVDFGRVAKVAINGLGADLREYLAWLDV